VSSKSFQRQLKNMNKAYEYQHTHVKHRHKKRDVYVWHEHTETAGDRYALSFYNSQRNRMVANSVYSQIKDK